MVLIRENSKLKLPLFYRFSCQYPFINYTVTDNDNEEEKPLKIKKLKKKSMKFSNETTKGGSSLERPFSCNLCNMTFIQKGHLTNHEIHKHKVNKNLGDVSEKSSVDLPEPPTGLLENYYDLDLSVEFLSQLFEYVNELCEYINDGDRNVNRSSVVIQNLNDAVRCYQDHLPVLDPTQAIKGGITSDGIFILVPFLA